ncbi:MAG: hypothetical protein L0211_10165 [Planctomycetaceae bacterium]|nr:hypothetical protein [Planctomycetaceae bacterium]
MLLLDPDQLDLRECGPEEPQPKNANPIIVGLDNYKLALQNLPLDKFTRHAAVAGTTPIGISHSCESH